jgi:hypothetical protein
MRLMLGVAALAANVIAAPAAIALDQSLPAYQAVTGISGQIKSVGSDTLGHEITLWAKAFKGLYPDVKIEIEASGSATAPPALLEGASQFGPMSRPMTAKEAEAFEKKYGYKASSFHVAVDALAIYVNKDNPVQCLAVQQLNRIFSSTRRTAGGADIKTWGEVGLTGEWATKPISLYGAIPFRELTGILGTWLCLMGTTRRMSSNNPVPRRSFRELQAMGLRSGIPASATRPMASARSLWLCTQADLAMILPLKRPFLANILSRDICASI